MNRVPIDAQAKTDEQEAQASSPLDDLRSIAPLILDVELRDSVLARYDGPRRLVAQDALQYAAQLMQVSDWTGEQLLWNLGCRLTVKELKDVDLRRLERCQHLLRLISRLTGLVDLLEDRRTVIIECAGLLEDIRTDAQRLAEIMETSGWTAAGQFTPIDYIRLGEISFAAELARSIADPSGPETGGHAAPRALEGVPASHLSNARIGVYVGPSRESLGAEVSQRISAHLEHCDACRDAVRYCERGSLDMTADSSALPG